MAMSRRALLGGSAATAAALGAEFGFAAPAAATAGRGQEKALYDGRKRPNLLFIVLDDVGFADLGCYGSEIPTPAIDSLARQGLRFSNFHSAPMCSPTRASLLTGRNPHAAGVGTIADWADARPGYQGTVRPEIEMLPALLQKGGYGCYASGKWHLTRLKDEGPTGPFDNWPTRRGFDRWYGFHGATADHWYPELFEGTSAVEATRPSDYHLSEDLVARMVGYLADHASSAPERPFFGYLAFGACHWPLQVPKPYVDNHAGRYVEGWEVMRRRRFERQKQLGIVPVGAVLPDVTPNIPEWQSLPATEQRFAARTMEVYAGMLEHTDAQIGKLLAFLDRAGLRDDTMIVLLSDNGATSEGAAGYADFRQQMYVAPETLQGRARAIDELGGNESFPVYSAGWAAASNTPLRWFKSTAHEGGVRTPMIMSWPGGRLVDGGIRGQFHHVSDIVPTVLDVTGLPPVKCDGMSLSYLFADPSSATRKRQQIFESTGSRALWEDGWKAVTRHQAGKGFAADQWELYHISRDFAENNDLAVREPARLAAMKAQWERLAQIGDVLPLRDERNATPNLPAQRETYLFFPGGSRLDRLSMPNFQNAHRIVATLDLSSATEGVIVAAGNLMRGFELVIKNGELHYVYVAAPREVYRVRAGGLPRGRCELGVRLSDGPGQRGAELTINGRVVATAQIARSWPSRAAGAGLRIGTNYGAPISRLYSGPFSIPHARLHHVAIEML